MGILLEELALSWCWLQSKGHVAIVCRMQSHFFRKTSKTESQTVGSYYSFCDILWQYSPSFYLNPDINMLILVLLLNSSLLNYILLSFISIDMALFCTSYPNLVYHMDLVADTGCLTYLKKYLTHTSDDGLGFFSRDELLDSNAMVFYKKNKQTKLQNLWQRNILLPLKL